MTTFSRREKKVLIPSMATAALCLVAVSACGSDPASEEGGTEVEASVVRVALPTGVTSFANADVVVADELGYFEEVGITIETTNLRSGSSVTTGVVGGDFEVGGASIEPVINAFAGGADIRVIGSYTDRLEVEFVVTADIESPEDLRGKVLGIQEIGAFREVMTRMVLEEAGMSPNDVDYASVNAQAYIAALVQGQISSAVLHPEQAIQAERQDENLHSIVNLYEVEPDYFYGAYFVSNDWLEDNQETAQAFVQALTRAHRTMYEDREAVVPIIAEASGFEEDIIDEAYDVYMTEVQAFPVNEGLEEDRLEYTVQRMAEMGTLREGDAPDMTSLVDRDPITAAVEELGREPERS